LSRRPKSVLGSRRANDDVDLPHRLDRLPDTDIARFHHKAVAGAKNARVIAPAGFDPDESHYGLIWTGETELSGKSHDLALWLQGQCKFI
jgi:hypothetical protein